MNLLEKAIETLAPGWASSRAMHRVRLTKLRGYEGAATGRRTDNWRTATRDANAEIAPSLQMLRNRSRDLRRNNALANCAIESIIDNAVAYGIKPKPKSKSKRINKRAAELWKLHAETKAIDYDGEHDIYGLEALAMGTIAESGAVLVRRRLLTTQQRKERGCPLPFQIQVLEPDLIDMNRDGVQPDGSTDIKGVRYEKNGGIRGYWLYENHPGSNSLRLSSVSKFVPARDVLHVFRKDRAGQVHGVPWAAPVMLRMRNYDEFEDARLEQQKVAACFGIWFTVTDAETDKTKMQIADRLEPGGIGFAPPGTGVTTIEPPSVDGYKDFSWINLHAIAAGFGVPYEVFGDLTGVNFSSGRMGWQNYQRRIDRWQWQMFIPGMCAGVWSWFVSSCQFMGEFAEDCPAEWVPPRRMMVNPKEEVAAIKEEIRNGLTTWQQALAERGYDAEEQAATLKEANELLDSHGLKLDCDPRFALPAGSAGQTGGNSNAGNNDDKNSSGGQSKEDESK